MLLNSQFGFVSREASYTHAILSFLPCTGGFLGLELEDCWRGAGGGGGYCQNGRPGGGNGGPGAGSPGGKIQLSSSHAGKARLGLQGPHVDPDPRTSAVSTQLSTDTRLQDFTSGRGKNRAEARTHVLVCCLPFRGLGGLVSAGTLAFLRLSGISEVG